MGKGENKDLKILTRSRLEWILIDVMRGSWQPQGLEVWKGRDNPGLPISWQPRLGVRQPGHSPDWWAPCPDLQTKGQSLSPSPYPISYPDRVEPVRHELPQTALCPHNHSQWLPSHRHRWMGKPAESERFFYFCYCVFVYMWACRSSVKLLVP